MFVGLLLHFASLFFAQALGRLREDVQSKVRGKRGLATRRVIADYCRPCRIYLPVFVSLNRTLALA